MANVGTFRVHALQRRSSGRPSTSELLEKAREVCAARWYDPATGEFLSVDPDFSKTLDAYGYADENPLDGTDPSGLSGETAYCKAHPGAGSCAPAVTACPRSGCPLTPTEKHAAAAVGQAQAKVLQVGQNLKQAEATAAAALKTCRTANTVDACNAYLADDSLVSMQTSDLKTSELGLTMADENLAQAIADPSPQGSSLGRDILIGTGVLLSVAAAATGVGAVVEGATITGVLLGTTSAVTGAVGASLDAQGCFGDHNGAACIGYGLGTAATVTGLASTGGAALSVFKLTQEFSTTSAVLGGLGGFGAYVGIAATIYDSMLATLGGHNQ